jgi:hypothetical protein
MFVIWKAPDSAALHPGYGILEQFQTGWRRVYRYGLDTVVARMQRSEIRDVRYLEGPGFRCAASRLRYWLYI